MSSAVVGTPVQALDAHARTTQILLRRDGFLSCDRLEQNLCKQLLPFFHWKRYGVLIERRRSIRFSWSCKQDQTEDDDLPNINISLLVLETTTVSSFPGCLEEALTHRTYLQVTVLLCQH
jgi:hypothetical protein